MYKTLQLFTNRFEFNRNKFTHIKVIKLICADTKLIKMPSSIKLGFN